MWYRLISFRLCIEYPSMRVNRCHACETVQPYWKFTKDRSRRSKLANKCKVCVASFGISSSQMIRNRLTNRMSKIIGKKLNSCECQALLGCSWEEVVNYLLQRLPEGKELKGMHIDHVLPFGTAGTLDEKKRRCHYTNLELVAPAENMHRWAKCALIQYGSLLSDPGIPYAQEANS